MKPAPFPARLGRTCVFNARRRRRIRIGSSARLALIAVAFGACVATGAEMDRWPLLRPPMFCFPPGVPVSGERIAETPASARMKGAVEPPEELADFVGESFYPALGSRLLGGSLGAALQSRLDAYRSARSALVNELADELVALSGVDEAAREAVLRSLAERQNPRIAALESDAEALRRDLIVGGLLQRHVEWGRSRDWIVGVTRFPHAVLEREAEFQIVRAAAYYQDGLLPEQRGLLLEVAEELRLRALAARAAPPRRTADPGAMYFSPATARLRLPANATPELVARFGRFNAERRQLQNELRDAVLAHDKEPRSVRASAFADLADRQWPRLAELEQLAEEIRVNLAALPIPRLASPPYIPPTLITRIDTYRTQRKKMFDELQQALDVALSMAVRPRIYPAMDKSQQAQLAEDRAAVRNRVTASFLEAARERVDELRKQYDDIQADLTLVSAGQSDPETGRPLTPDTLLRGYSVALERFETFGREEVIYKSYRLAMLMPGLSREQRRLLFNVARVGLAQPLPWSELDASGPQPVPRS
ncbi:hypothetical protein [Horticoccus sp. 23ND18S-11]|uniref:hypothetical protein n=1 Tax=Horticoccus sp. 23ND18S-11 TaxID=3391832 RepID=UPI0039C91985